MTISRMFVGALVALVLAVQVQAVPIWGTDADPDMNGMVDGTRSTNLGGGLDGTGSWGDGGFSVTWDVDFADGLWTYKYDVTAFNKGISHFLLEVTDDGDDVFIADGSGPFEKSGDETPKTFDENDPGKSNPGLQGDIFAVKLGAGVDPGEGNNPNPSVTTYTIITDRAPVYGVGYWKDGTDNMNTVDVYAFSTAMNSDDYRTDDNLSINDFIVRPNGASTDGKTDDGDPDGKDGGPGPGAGMPEPATAMLALMAAPLLMRRRRNA